MKRWAALAMVAAAVLVAEPLVAQCQLQKLTASDALALDQFGQSVSISGDQAVIGSFLDDVGAVNCGSAYVFRRIGASWVQQVRLTASDQAFGDHFGRAVSINGDTIIVGCPLDDDLGSDSGSAYVFVRNSVTGLWSQQAKLTASDGFDGDQFGIAVALDGDRALIGAMDHDIGGAGNAGASYVFQRNGANWTQEAKLVAPDAAANDKFGQAVALSGDLALVGAPLDDDAGISSGSAYLFAREGDVWTLQDKLAAADAQAGDQLGFSVALEGELALAGAPLDDHSAGNAGSAYVFLFVGPRWVELAKLTAGDAAPNDQFGWAAALADDKALIGANLADVGAAADAGAAYVFRIEGDIWVDQAKITAAEPGTGDEFAAAVALGGTDASGDHDLGLIGARFDDDLGSNAGAAYLIEGFSGSDCDADGQPDACETDCNDNGVPDDCDLLEGASEDCNDNGVPDECDIAAGDAEDCNDNDVPDECEIGEGTAPDCNDNGVPDACDIAGGTSVDFDGDGVPDDCEQDCDSDGLPNYLEILLGLAADVDGNGVPDACEDCDGDGQPNSLEADCDGDDVPDACEIERGQAADCDRNGVPDACEVVTGARSDANGDGVPDDCEDCDGDGISDADEIGAGAADCDADGEPDACALTRGGDAADCNRNGILDSCDIAGGVSADVNGNGVPDECDGDCDEDGVPDFAEIASGAAADLDGDGLPDSCESDCDEDGIPDFIEIAFGLSDDEDGDGVPDQCEGADLDDDGVVGGLDLAILLGAWTGAVAYAPCPPQIQSDLNDDCKVNGLDLAIVLGSWGPIF